MIIFEATIEEFEQGAWVADLLSADQFNGSFDLGGATWVGTMVSEKLDAERYRTRVIGGKNKLSAPLRDKYYDGSVTVQVAVQDVCREAGETFGGAQAGAQLTTFQRIRCPATQALDAIARAFDLKWWIGRDGGLQMLSGRPIGGVATGTIINDDVDQSCDLVEPVGVVLGGTLEGKTIRHIRWQLDAKRFSARVYFVPFIFRAPVQTAYDRIYSARVDRDNNDGTIDVIADARFGVTKVRLFGGVPGSKIKMNGGEEVMLGFFGGDPQKPYCMAMAQNTAATKNVARVDDSVGCGTLAGVAPPGGGAVTFTYTPPDGVPGVPNTTASLSGKITSGSERLKVGD